MKYLTAEDFMAMIRCVTEDEQVEILTKNVMYNIIEFEGSLYRLNESTLVYSKYPLNDTSVLGFFASYLSKSIRYLSNDSKHAIASTNDHQFKKFQRSSVFVANLRTQIRELLTTVMETKPDFQGFDQDRSYIHFTNGYMDLVTGKFNKRELGKHFIMYTTGYDYDESEEKEIKFVENILNKTYREPEAMNYMLHYYGMALSGDAVKNCSIMINIGKGARGKTLMLKMIQASIGRAYYREFDSDMFAVSNTKKDKMYNELHDKPVRIMSVNECTSSKLSTANLKKVADGELQTTKLYKEGQFDFLIQANLVITTNLMINFQCDTGINRRIVGYEYKNEFVRAEEKHRADNKTIFVEDQSMKSRFQSDPRLKLAVFNLLLPYTMKWYKNNKLINCKVPDVMNGVKDEMI